MPRILASIMTAWGMCCYGRATRQALNAMQSGGPRGLKKLSLNRKKKIGVQYIHTCIQKLLMCSICAYSYRYTCLYIYSAYTNTYHTHFFAAEAYSLLDLRSHLFPIKH